MRQRFANVKNPMLASLCLITGSTLGGSKEYLTSIINAKDVDKLEYGESLCVFSPTGSGKTKAMELIIAALSSDSHLIVLANRCICKTQVLKDLIKCPNIPGALIEKIKVNDNVEVMTYQEFARKKHKYQGKKLILICDECHCFAEDATFSLYPQHVVNFLNGNLDNTKRIYITATPSDVLPILWDIENLSDKPLFPFDPDNMQHFLRVTPDAGCTRIKHTYIMQPDWTYLKFAVYRPAKRKELAEYIQKFCVQGKKALIYINNKATDNPDFALQYLNQPNPYVILKKPLVNYIGLQQLRTQLNHIRVLKADGIIDDYFNKVVIDKND